MDAAKYESRERGCAGHSITGLEGLFSVRERSVFSVCSVVKIVVEGRGEIGIGDACAADF